jgi:phosphonoacetaldehyde hydrolase
MLTTIRRSSSIIVSEKPTRIRSVVLDFSGTLIDPHVLAPACAFVEAFKKVGFSITMDEAREPMGKRKDVHIAKILENPRVRERWNRKFGHMPNDFDQKRLFDCYQTVQMPILKECSNLIPGVSFTCKKLKERNILLGATTGFNRKQVDLIEAEILKRDFKLDTCVAGDDLLDNRGIRPLPHMVWQNMKNLGITNPSEVIKVDDTISGLMEGKNAGVWTVGVYDWSNYTNVNSLDQWINMIEE